MLDTIMIKTPETIITDNKTMEGYGGKYRKKRGT